MDKKIIIIGILSTFLIITCCYIGYTLLTPQTEYVTYNITENGTTIEVPKDMEVRSENVESGIFVLENDNTIVVIFNSENKNVGQIMAFANIKNPIFGSEFNGNTTLNNPTVAGCSLEGECNAVFISNSETHDNIIVISKDKNIVNHIINSIHWKGTNNSVTSSSTSTESNNDKTYPFYGDDGSIVGYYHVGDTIEYMDVILQLQSNGQWVKIGEATGSEAHGYSQGYSDGIDDSSYSSQQSSSSSGSNVETTTEHSSSSSSHSGGGSESSVVDSEGNLI